MIVLRGRWLASLPMFCLLASAPAAIGGELSLHALADNDSSYYEYYSEGFVRMDQFASSNPTNSGSGVSTTPNCAATPRLISSAAFRRSPERASP